jgi:hypothetical protein
MLYAALCRVPQATISCSCFGMVLPIVFTLTPRPYPSATWAVSCVARSLQGRCRGGVIYPGILACSSFSEVTSNITRCRCGITDETCAELAKLGNMTHLEVQYCPISNAGLALISAGMPRLEYCSLEGCNITCLGMLALIRRHKGLRVWGPGALCCHGSMH